MKVLVLGGGGREHALVWKIRQSPKVREVHCIPGNPGIARLAVCADVVLKAPFLELIEYCARERIDCVVVGPEAPLVAGAADALAAAKIPCFGASKAAAQLEGSKAFTRVLMREAGAPTHEWEAFDAAAPGGETAIARAKAYYRSHAEPWWIKADGLAAGKGAVLPESVEAGCAMLEQWMAGGGMGDAGRCVVIEEPLAGPEVSVIAFADGQSVRLLSPSQDHKRLMDADRGPNTGGMGALAPSPKASPAMLAEVERDFLSPTLKALRARGIEFRGVMYAGILLTSKGPRLLEYNVRLGDPETQAILPLLDNDIMEVIEAVVAGRLHEIEVRAKPGAAVNVVAAAEGYPGTPRKGDVISGLEEAEAVLSGHGMVFHAGTKFGDDGQILTNGGRVLGVTAWAGAGSGENPLAAARDLAYSALSQIQWRGLQYRRDIAAWAR